MKNSLLVFSGTANKPLVDKICKYLNIPLGQSVIQRFPDGEIDCKVLDDVRGADVYIVQPTCPPVNDSLMELLILIDCVRRASAERVAAVVPYFGYARQDRKAEGRVPISAKLVANMIVASGANRCLAMDLHSHQIQGFFDIPMDHLYAAPVIIDYFSRAGLTDLAMASPDVGGIKMARSYAKRLHASLVVVDKRRKGPEDTEVMNVIGDVKDKNVILVDDMISTGTSVVAAGRACLEKGAKSVRIAATHPIFAEGAVDKILNSEVKECIISDTIPYKGKKDPRIKVLSVAKLLGEAIRRIHHSESISLMFD